MSDDDRVSNFRRLRFDNIADLFEELERIESAHKNGSLTTTGNWTPGQIFSHLAAWIEYGYDGFPLEAPPFFVRWMLKFMLKGMLSKGEMKPGMKIPGVEAGTIGQEEMETVAAIERFRAAVLRMQSEPAIHHSPAFGKVSDDVRIKMSLIHAQLHIGFLDYPY